MRAERAQEQGVSRWIGPSSLGPKFLPAPTFWRQKRNVWQNILKFVLIFGGLVLNFGGLMHLTVLKTVIRSHQLVDASDGFGATDPQP